MTTFPLTQSQSQARRELGILIVESIDRTVREAVRPSGSKDVAVVYARAALEPDVERQFAICGEYIAAKGMTLRARFVDHAPAGSGAIGRSGLSEMLQSAVRGEFGVIVVEGGDRLFRDLALLQDLYTGLQRLGIEIHQPGRGNLGIADVCIRGIMASDGRRVMRERTRYALRYAAREGRIPGLPPYGYKAVPGRPGKPVIVARQASVIRDIYRMRVEGMGCASIAATLNETRASRRAWTGAGIRRLLENPLYDGVLIYGMRVVAWDPATGRRSVVASPAETWSVTPVEHLRVVDHETWRAAQATFRRPDQTGRCR